MYYNKKEILFLKKNGPMKEKSFLLDESELILLKNKLGLGVVINLEKILKSESSINSIFRIKDLKVRVQVYLS
jgi:hypothetical protein